MDVLILTVFISLILSGSGVLFFIWNVGRKHHEHIDRLTLLPLDDRAERRAQLTDQTHERTEP